MSKYIVVLCAVVGTAIAAQLQFVEAIGLFVSDEAQEIVRTSDDGYALAGFTASLGAGGHDMLLSRFDKFGYLMWTRSLGGPNDDRAYSVATAHDNGFVIVGNTNSYGAGTGDIMVAKFDSMGNFLWAKTIGGSQPDRAYHIIRTTDNGFALAGVTDSYGPQYDELFVVKLDSLGEFLWATTMGWWSNEGALSITQTSDSGYAVTGYSWSFTSNDQAIVLCKLNSSGGVQWSRNMGSGGGPYDGDVGNCIIATHDSCVVVAGGTERYDVAGVRDCFLSKFDESGNHIWTKSWGGTGADGAFSVVLAPDSGFVVTGYTQSYGAGLDDVILTKFNASGDHVWSRAIGESNSDKGFSITVASDDGFAIAGIADSLGVGSPNMLLIKSDRQGSTGFGSSISPVVGSPSPTVNTQGPAVTHPTPNIQTQTPTVFVCTLYVSIMCYNDSVPPLPFDLRDPQDSAMLSTARPAFLWQESFDAVCGLQDYEVYVDDTSRTRTPDTTWIPGYNLSESWHTWYIVAYDSAGHVQQSNDTWSVFIDTTAPVIESTTVWHDTAYAGPFEVFTKTMDSLAGLDSVLLYYKRDEDANWVSLSMHATGTPHWFMDSIPIAANPDDSVRYYIKVFDITEPANTVTDPPNAPTDYYAFIAGFTGIMENRNKPTVFSFRLTSNPIRGRVAFALALPYDADVTLHIYDAVGRLVGTPVSGRHAAGFYEIPWNTDVSAGIYFYSLKSPWEEKTGKLVLLK